MLKEMGGWIVGRYQLLPWASTTHTTLCHHMDHLHKLISQPLKKRKSFSLPWGCREVENLLLCISGNRLVFLSNWVICFDLACKGMNFTITTFLFSYFPLNVSIYYISLLHCYLWNPGYYAKNTNRSKFVDLLMFIKSTLVIDTWQYIFRKLLSE